MAHVKVVKRFTEILQFEESKEIFSDNDPLWDELSSFSAPPTTISSFAKRFRNCMGDDNCDSTDEKVKNYKIDTE